MQVYPEAPLHVTSLALRSQRDHQVREGPLNQSAHAVKKVAEEKKKDESNCVI